jgi:hypothetical protein
MRITFKNLNSNARANRENRDFAGVFSATGVLRAKLASLKSRVIGAQQKLSSSCGDVPAR